MIRTEVLKHIREIELHTKRIMRGMLFGQSSSAVKGSGFEFDQIREYQPGDDVRFIDWKSSARTGKLMTRQYIEERSRTTIIVIDSSSSMFAGSAQRKYAIAAEIGAVLALLSEYAHDKVGLLIFADQVELFIPPSRGQMHVQHILHKLFEVEQRTGVKTRFDLACEYIGRLSLQQAMVYILSDFIGDLPDRVLSLVAKRFDTIAVRCLDPFEQQLPAVGFIPVQDAETGEQILLDARRATSSVQHFLHERVHEQNRVLRSRGIDLLDVRVGSNYVRDMIFFFKKRML